jgi:hypothetical protein
MRADGSHVIVGASGDFNATFNNDSLIFKTSSNSFAKTGNISESAEMHAEANQFAQPTVPGAPISKIVPQQITLSDANGAIFTSFVFLGLVFCLILHVYFWIYRKEKVVRKTSPIFNQLILIGIDMVFISQIFWVIQQSTVFCILKVYFVSIGFGLVMG